MLMILRPPHGLTCHVQSLSHSILQCNGCPEASQAVGQARLSDKPGCQTGQAVRQARQIFLEIQNTQARLSRQKQISCMASLRIFLRLKISCSKRLREGDGYQNCGIMSP